MQLLLRNMWPPWLSLWTLVQRRYIHLGVSTSVILDVNYQAKIMKAFWSLKWHYLVRWFSSLTWTSYLFSVCRQGVGVQLCPTQRTWNINVVRHPARGSSCLLEQTLQLLLWSGFKVQLWFRLLWAAPRPLEAHANQLVSIITHLLKLFSFPMIAQELSCPLSSVAYLACWRHLKAC